MRLTAPLMMIGVTLAVVASSPSASANSFFVICKKNMDSAAVRSTTTHRYLVAKSRRARRIAPPRYADTSRPYACFL